MRTEKSTNPCRDTIPINFFIKVRFKNNITKKSCQHNFVNKFFTLPIVYIILIPYLCLIIATEQLSYIK